MLSLLVDTFGLDELHESLNFFAAFLLYTVAAIAVSLVLMMHCSPRCGQTNIMVYLSICSIIGSLTV